MVSKKHYVFKNVHFLKMLQKRYTGGRFSTLKPLQNKSFFVTCSFSEGILMILKSKKITFRKVIFSQCRNVECSEKSHRPWDPSANHANTIGKRDVFENGAVARMFLRFRALKTVEIHCFWSPAILAWPEWRAQRWP
mgnify:CR=1 FL=1